MMSQRRERMCNAQEELQAAYTALQVAEDRSALLQRQLKAAPAEAAAAANEKVSPVCPTSAHSSLCSYAFAVGVAALIAF